jgi:hypothetical protein
MTPDNSGPVKSFAIGINSVLNTEDVVSGRYGYPSVEESRPVDTLTPWEYPSRIYIMKFD